MDAPTKVRSDWQARIWIEGAGEAERRLEVTPAIAGWSALSFRTYTFRANQTIAGESAADEMAMVLLSGSITMEVAGPRWQETWACPGRPTVFDGAPYVIYLPPGHTYTMTAHTDADCAYGRAPGAGARAPRLIRPEDVRLSADGNGARTRHLLTAGVTEHLRCAETVLAPGGWTSSNIPDAAGALAVERVSYFRIRPETGRGTLWPTADESAGDQAVTVEHGDALIIRGGLGRVVSAPATDLYRLTNLVASDPEAGLL